MAHRTVLSLAARTLHPRRARPLSAPAVAAGGFRADPLPPAAAAAAAARIIPARSPTRRPTRCHPPRGGRVAMIATSTLPPRSDADADADADAPSPASASGPETRPTPSPPHPSVSDPAPVDSERVDRLFQRILDLDMVQVGLVIHLLLEKMGMDPKAFERSVASATASTSARAEKEEEGPKEVRIAFDLKLTGFDAKSKIKVIKEVRTMTGLGLKEAKEMVEGAPKVIMKEVKRDEIEELKKRLEEVGGEAEIV